MTYAVEIKRSARKILLALPHQVRQRGIEPGPFSQNQFTKTGFAANWNGTFPPTPPKIVGSQFGEK